MPSSCRINHNLKHYRYNHVNVNSDICDGKANCKGGEDKPISDGPTDSRDLPDVPTNYATPVSKTNWSHIELSSSGSFRQSKAFLQNLKAMVFIDHL